MFASIHKYVLKVVITLLIDNQSVFTWGHKPSENVKVRQVLFQMYVIFSYDFRRINQQSVKSADCFQFFLKLLLERSLRNGLLNHEVFWDLLVQRIPKSDKFCHLL